MAGPRRHSQVLAAERVGRHPLPKGVRWKHARGARYHHVQRSSTHLHHTAGPRQFEIDQFPQGRNRTEYFDLDRFSCLFLDHP
jgi:hypothetical protein